MNDNSKVRAGCSKGRKTKITRKADDCAVCFGPHNEKIHAASIRIRLWFGEEVRRSVSESV